MLPRAPARAKRGSALLRAHLAAGSGEGDGAGVRLSGRGDRTVRVRLLAAKSREVSNRNRVAERRGGEQRNEKDQTVTQGCREAVRRELDSVGVGGRAFE